MTPSASSIVDKTADKLSASKSSSEVSSSRSRTTAAFSPVAADGPPSARPRSTILVHKKSPLLVATPPAVTRALAFSHPFIYPLAKVAGLLTWSTDDAWESFLLLSAFWALVLYGDVLVRYAGPLLMILGLALGMYSRRYSPLSSTHWSDEKRGNNSHGGDQGNSKHQKSLDEIVDTLNFFRTRCHMLLQPLLQITEFLSTQKTARSATTRPALTSLFIRLLFITPVWIILTFPPFNILTTKRILLMLGTIILSWHSNSARVTRTLLWRSRMVRRIAIAATGLDFAQSERQEPIPQDNDRQPVGPSDQTQKDYASSLISKDTAPPAGVRFTFVVYENQRRWLGLGWTSTLLAYERAAWTDEHLNPSDSKDDFQLPAENTGQARWRWAPDSEWKVDCGRKGGTKDASTSEGWIYYDNTWDDGRRGQDGWGRYTRRRRWYRDAELVETDPVSHSQLRSSEKSDRSDSAPDQKSDLRLMSHQVNESADADTPRRRSIFRRRSSVGDDNSDISGTTTLRNEDDDAASRAPLAPSEDEKWEMADEVKMRLG